MVISTNSHEGVLNIMRDCANNHEQRAPQEIPRNQTATNISEEQKKKSPSIVGNTMFRVATDLGRLLFSSSAKKKKK